MTIYYGCKHEQNQDASQEKSTACTAFQTEDHSDRHPVSETEPANPKVTGQNAVGGQIYIVRPVCCRRKAEVGKDATSPGK